MPETIAEQLPSPESERPSNRLILHVVHGQHDANQPLPDQLPDKVSEKSFDALRNQNKAIRKRDEERFTDRIKQAFIAEGKKEEEITPEMIRERQLNMWGKLAFLDMVNDVNTRQGKIAEIFANKLGVPIQGGMTPDAILRLEKYFYDPETQTEGAFYKKFCGENMNESLAEALTVEDMMLLKSFLTNWMVGTDTAFDALVALRMAKDSLADEAERAQLTNPTPLTERDRKILSFYHEGASQKTQQEEQAQRPPEVVQPEPQIEQETPRLGVATEAHPDHEAIEGEKRNDDTYFLDPEHLRGGIFDGAGGYANGNLASKTARDAIQEVLQRLPSPASEKATVEALSEALLTANERVAALVKPGEKIGTTAAVFQVIQNPDGSRKILIANVGDSRVWIRHKDGTITQATRDGGHLRSMYLKGMEQAVTNEERTDQTEGYRNLADQLDNATSESDVANPLLHILWAHRNETTLLGSGKPLEEIAELIQEPLSEGDTIFMTTDGVHDNLTNAQIAEIAKQTANPQELSERLVAQAREISGSKSFRAKLDDITAAALVIKLEQQKDRGQQLRDLLASPTTGPEIRERIDDLLTDPQLRETIFNGKDFENMFIEAVSAPKGPDGTILPTSANFSLIMADGSESRLSANPAKGLHSGDRSIPLQESDGQNAKSLGRDSFWAVRQLVLRNPGQPEVVTYDRDAYLLGQPNILQQVFTTENGQVEIRQEQPSQAQPATESLESNATAENSTIQNVQKIIASLRQPGIRRLGKEITFTDEELQQMDTFTKEAQAMVDADPKLQDLLKTIRHYVSIDKGFEIAAGLGTGIVANPNISTPRVIPNSGNQPMRIEAPQQLYELYDAHNNADVAVSLLKQYRDTVGKGGTGNLGSFFANNLEKTLTGYMVLMQRETKEKTSPELLFPDNRELQNAFAQYGIGTRIPNVLKISKAQEFTIIGYGIEQTLNHESIPVAILDVSTGRGSVHLATIPLNELQKKLDEKQYRLPLQVAIPPIPQQLQDAAARYVPQKSTELIPDGIDKWLQVRIIGYAFHPITKEPLIRFAQIPYRRVSGGAAPETGGTTTMMSLSEFKARFGSYPMR